MKKSVPLQIHYHYGHICQEKKHSQKATRDSTLVAMIL